VSSFPANGTVLVTGATGFVGGALVRRMLHAGRSVRALSRSPMPRLEALGATAIRADINDAMALRAACDGVSTVFHAAARVGIWGPRREFERTNVQGTATMVEACRACGVPRFIFTSSPSVVFNHRDLAGADESLPHGTEFPADYPRTKAEAERLVLSANAPDGLRTCALRPHLVWGPGDRYLIPRVVARARAGKLRIIGEGRNRVDLTHIDNVIDAHVLAEQALARPNSPAAGRAYFITNDEPVLLWDWINALLAQLEIPPVTKRISLARARRAGAFCEMIWRLGALRSEPPMTRFLALELAKDHWFNIAAARRDLRYSPRVSMEAGLNELLPLL
jgi:nucleoside-diphosphate-sugar epimerase